MHSCRELNEETKKAHKLNYKANIQITQNILRKLHKAKMDKKIENYRKYS